MFSMPHVPVILSAVAQRERSATLRPFGDDYLAAFRAPQGPVFFVLSRRKHGFDSRWARQRFQQLTAKYEWQTLILSNIWPISGRGQKANPRGQMRRQRIVLDIATRMITSL